MTDAKNPADRLVEVLLFAPVGLALSARELLPELVERGRRQVSGQVGVARMLGQLAVRQGQAEAEKAFDRARTQAQDALDQLGGQGQGSSGPSPAPSATPARPPLAGEVPATRAPAATGRRPAKAATATRPARGRPAPVPSPPSPTPVPVRGPGRPAAVGSPTELAIPDYDSLSASQVVPRLSGLTPGELEAVRLHESAGRARKTILSRVAQLQGS